MRKILLATLWLITCAAVFLPLGFYIANTGHIYCRGEVIVATEAEHAEFMGWINSDDIHKVLKLELEPSEAILPATYSFKVNMPRRIESPYCAHRANKGMYGIIIGIGVPITLGGLAIVLDQGRTRP